MTTEDRLALATQALEEIAVERGADDDDPPDICEHCIRSYEVCDADDRFVAGESRCPGGVARRTLAQLRQP